MNTMDDIWDAIGGLAQEQASDLKSKEEAKKAKLAAKYAKLDKGDWDSGTNAEDTRYRYNNVDGVEAYHHIDLKYDQNDWDSIKVKRDTKNVRSKLYKQFAHEHPELSMQDAIGTVDAQALALEVDPNLNDEVRKYRAAGGIVSDFAPTTWDNYNLAADDLAYAKKDKQLHPDTAYDNTEAFLTGKEGVFHRKLVDNPRFTDEMTNSGHSGVGSTDPKEYIKQMYAAKINAEKGIGDFSTPWGKKIMEAANATSYARNKYMETHLPAEQELAIAEYAAKLDGKEIDPKVKQNLVNKAEIEQYYKDRSLTTEKDGVVNGAKGIGSAIAESAFQVADMAAEGTQWLANAAGNKLDADWLKNDGEGLWSSDQMKAGADKLTGYDSRSEDSAQKEAGKHMVKAWDNNDFGELYDAATTVGSNFGFLGHMVLGSMAALILPGKVAKYGVQTVTGVRAAATAMVEANKGLKMGEAVAAIEKTRGTAYKAATLLASRTGNINYAHNYYNQTISKYEDEHHGKTPDTTTKAALFALGLVSAEIDAGVGMAILKGKGMLPFAEEAVNKLIGKVGEKEATGLAGGVIHTVLGVTAGIIEEGGTETLQNELEHIGSDMLVNGKTMKEMHNEPGYKEDMLMNALGGAVGGHHMHLAGAGSKMVMKGIKNFNGADTTSTTADAPTIYSTPEAGEYAKSINGVTTDSYDTVKKDIESKFTGSDKTALLDELNAKSIENMVLENAKPVVDSEARTEVHPDTANVLMDHVESNAGKYSTVDIETLGKNLGQEDRANKIIDSKNTDVQKSGVADIASNKGVYSEGIHNDITEVLQNNEDEILNDPKGLAGIMSTFNAYAIPKDAVGKQKHDEMKVELGTLAAKVMERDGGVTKDNAKVVVLGSDQDALLNEVANDENVDEGTRTAAKIKAKLLIENENLKKAAMDNPRASVDSKKTIDEVEYEVANGPSGYMTYMNHMVTALATDNTEMFDKANENLHRFKGLQESKIAAIDDAIDDVKATIIRNGSSDGSKIDSKIAGKTALNTDDKSTFTYPNKGGGEFTISHKNVANSMANGVEVGGIYNIRKYVEHSVQAMGDIISEIDDRQDGNSKEGGNIGNYDTVAHNTINTAIDNVSNNPDSTNEDYKNIANEFSKYPVPTDSKLLELHTETQNKLNAAMGNINSVHTGSSAVSDVVEPSSNVKTPFTEPSTDGKPEFNNDSYSNTKVTIENPNISVADKRSLLNSYQKPSADNEHASRYEQLDTLIKDLEEVKSETPIKGNESSEGTEEGVNKLYDTLISKYKGLLGSNGVSKEAKTAVEKKVREFAKSEYDRTKGCK